MNPRWKRTVSARLADGCRWSIVVLVLLLCGIGTAWGQHAVFEHEFEKDPRVKSTIRKAVAYLRKNIGTAPSDGRRSLAAYALLKAGFKEDLPLIQIAVGIIRQQKITNGVYKPANPREHIYEAGVDAMLLADVDPILYRNDVLAVANYIISQQGENGDWDYLERTTGDTSITQYGLLGLWAASRAGIRVPRAVWTRAASWHIETQLGDGGFTYHPGTHSGPANGGSYVSMTAAGAGSLLIIKSHLTALSPSSAAKEGKALKFGILERVESRPSMSADATTVAPKNVSTAEANSTADKGMQWLSSHFSVESPSGAKNYYHYTMERLGALSNQRFFGGHDWFKECGEELLAKQQPDGSWNTSTGPVVATSFAILFLTRSTAKMFQSPDVPDTVGEGMLIGGRGLPDDLSKAQLQDGKLVKQKSSGPIADLLSALETTPPQQMEKVQAEIVNKLQLENPEALIGQEDRLVKLAHHREADVRRTALWALARSRNLNYVPVFLEALHDNNVDVLVEANNGLCWLSRRPRGVGLPVNPLEGLAEGAPQEQRDEAVNKWREQTIRRWTEWYQQVRPYHTRDLLLE